MIKNNIQPNITRNAETEQTLLYENGRWQLRLKLAKLDSRVLDL